ncbi:MAG: hypothetical protein HY261_02020 [Chloroflexi bacterium]|nr:hypothetical protein [Chloroflexota bacterium]
MRVTKRVLAIGIGAAAATSLFGTVLAVNAQSGTGTPTPPKGTATPKSPNGRPHGPGHPGLHPFGGPRGPMGPKGGTALGGQFQYKDSSGKTHSIASHPGTVKSKTATSVTITPNAGGADQTYTFSNPDQRVQAVLARINVGDKVTVITDNDVATGIIGAPPMRGPKTPGQRPQLDPSQLRQRIQQQIDALQKRLNGLPTPTPSAGSGAKTST